MIWIVLMVIIILIVASGACFLMRRYKRLSFVVKAKEKSKILWGVILCIPIAVIIAISIYNVYIGVIGTLHLIGFWALLAFIAFAAKKISGKNISVNIQGALSLSLTIVYLSFGWYFAHHVYETSYTFDTQKDVGDGIRIAQIADLHLGATLTAEEFGDELSRIQKTNPDLLVVTGDFVDDATEKEEMIKACEILGSFKAPHGVYFVFGNHDKPYMPDSCDYTEDELYSELEKNNVIILEDEAVLIDDSFYIIGRQDKSDRARDEMDILMEGIDKSKYMIVLDHQPNDYDNESEAEVDLVLSGHTHGGHIFPAGLLGYIAGANDKVYGTERINKTDFVVTSGISGWAIPFKTFAISEYVVIDIK